MKPHTTTYFVNPSSICSNAIRKVVIEMTSANSPVAFWAIVVFLALSTILMLIAQTTPIFDYELAVRLGFQNGADQISEFGVQVIRAFCVSDTLVFIPLTLLSLIGLLLKKHWSLFTTAAVTGISIYWVVAYGFMVSFLNGMPGYHVVLGLPDWIIMGAYVVFGVWGLLYLIFRGEKLVG